jgi:hypothetical protein
VSAEATLFKQMLADNLGQRLTPELVLGMVAALSRSSGNESTGVSDNKQTKERGWPMTVEVPETYCDKSDEQQKNPLAKELLAKLANGDDAAFQWMWDFWCFTHMIDDLVDQDKDVTGPEAAKALARFVTALSMNPFYLQNAQSLYPLIISACIRWVDGDILDKSSDHRQRIHSEVVRCGDIDLFLHVALLTGGWDHMKRWSIEMRRYDKNKEN